MLSLFHTRGQVIANLVWSIQSILDRQSVCLVLLRVTAICRSQSQDLIDPPRLTLSGETIIQFSTTILVTAEHVEKQEFMSTSTVNSGY